MTLKGIDNYYVQKESILRRSVIYRSDLYVRHIEAFMELNVFKRRGAWTWAMKVVII